jgi:hypothetical protein
VDGRLDNQLDPDGRRKVDDDVRSIHELGEDRLVHNAVDGVVELRM